jgi:hypothetical protein
MPFWNNAVIRCSGSSKSLQPTAGVNDGHFLRTHSQHIFGEIAGRYLFIDYFQQIGFRDGLGNGQDRLKSIIKTRSCLRIISRKAVARRAGLTGAV